MLTHRVILSDNGVLTDYSLQNVSIPSVLVASEDYFYIGQQYPFNSFYIQVGTANTNSSVMSIEHWNGKSWASCVDVLDETATSGKTISTSGIVRFNTTKLNPWNIVQETNDDPMAALSSLYIYNNYWIRLKVSVTLSALTSITKIGYCLTNATLLSQLDADINEYLTSWATGKSNWLDQMFLASQHVVIELKQKNLINSHAQILQIDDEIKLLVAYRTLLLIYPNLGEKYGPKITQIEGEYKRLIDSIKPVIDLNNDGKINYKENELTQSRSIR